MNIEQNQKKIEESIPLSSEGRGPGSESYFLAHAIRYHQPPENKPQTVLEIFKIAFPSQEDFERSMKAPENLLNEEECLDCFAVDEFGNFFIEEDYAPVLPWEKSVHLFEEDHLIVGRPDFLRSQFLDSVPKEEGFLHLK